MRRGSSITRVDRPHHETAEFAVPGPAPDPRAHLHCSRSGAFAVPVAAPDPRAHLQRSRSGAAAPALAGAGAAIAAEAGYAAGFAAAHRTALPRVGKQPTEFAVSGSLGTKVTIVRAHLQRS